MSDPRTRDTDHDELRERPTMPHNERPEPMLSDSQLLVAIGNLLDSKLDSLDRSIRGELSRMNDKTRRDIHELRDELRTIQTNLDNLFGQQRSTAAAHQAEIRSLQEQLSAALERLGALEAWRKSLVDDGK